MGERSIPKRNLDHDMEGVLANVAHDIELYEDTRDPDDLVDVLEGIVEILRRLTSEK